MDESPKQLIGEVHPPLPGKPGSVEKIDAEYTRNGTIEIFMEVERLEIHYTPKHGSWLNMAEIELSVLQGQCLNRRIPDIETIRSEVDAWQTARNNRIKKIDWQFTTVDARVKLKRLYPKL